MRGREGMGKSPLEKLHSRAAGLAAAAGHQGSALEAPYLRSMDRLMDEFLEEAVLVQLPIGV